tara:strand:- start:7611 stop:9173 length:1563 start_codon:yes stop_codon:yes gene_type:complete
MSVAIIGGGFSGIYSLKYCLEHDLDATLFEASDHLGGVWKYRPDCNGGVLKTTHASSSIHYLHPLDFPFPDDTPLFPHHSVVLEHLLNYVKHFKLQPHISFNHRATKITKEDDEWVVQFDKNDKKTFKKVIVCVGVHNTPNIPPRFRDLSNVVHSHDYKLHSFDGQKVLIVGGGETANDIATELCNKCHLSMSIRNGQWFQGKILGGNEAADMLVNRLMKMVWIKDFSNWIGMINSFIWGGGGTGIDAWKPTCDYSYSFLTKGRECIEWIAKGKITPKGEIADISGNTIHFANGEKDDFDSILLCTGYTNEYLSPLLPHHTGEVFKHIFYIDDPTLAFCGFARPTLGSLPMVSEMQARLIANVFADKINLPIDMGEIYTKDVSNNKEYFKDTSQRLNYLVNTYHYNDELAELMGMKPNVWKLLFTNPYWCFHLMVNPWTHFHYTLFDKNERYRSTAEKMIEKIAAGPEAAKLRLCAYACFVAVIIALLIFYKLPQKDTLVSSLLLAYSFQDLYDKKNVVL